MPIRFSCPECGKELQTPDEMAGKRIKCKSCQTAMVVPGGPEPADHDAPAEESKPRKKRSASRASSGGSGMKAVLILGSLGLFGLCLVCGTGGGIYYYLNFVQGLGSDSKYLPDNVSNLQYVDIDNLKASASWVEMQKCPNFNRQMKLFEMAGKKVETSKVVIARAGGETMSILTLKKSATIGELVGENVKPREIQIAGKTAHEVNNALWFIDGKRVVVGPEKLVRSVLERKGDAKMSATMKTALRAASFGKPMVAVMDMGELRATGQAGDGFEMPDAMVAESDFRMPMNRRVVFICKDAETAKRVAEKAEKDRQRNKKVDNITIRTSGSHVIGEGTDSNACDGIGVGF